MSIHMGWLLQNAVIATAAALALLPVLRWWRPPARWEHLLWTVVAVKFLLPPLAAIPVAVQESIRNPVVVVAPDPITAAREAGLAREPARDAPGKVSEPARPDPAPFSVLPILLGRVWLLGAVTTLCIRLLFLRHWLRARRPSPAPAALRELVAQVAREVRVAPPRVELDAGLAGPAIAGLFRPRLYWPGAMVDVARDRARAMLAHELAHIRRGDLWLGVLELLIDCVWWWYPGWWLVRRRLRDASERACDEAVVAIYPRLRRAYAEALLDVAAASVPRPSVALGLDGPGRMQRRLRSILDGETRRGGRAASIAAVFLALIVLPAWRVVPAGVSSPAGAVAGTPESDSLIAALEYAARDPEAEVRRAAANALRDLGGERAELVLRELADDANANVRRAARAALGLEPPRPNLAFPSPPRLGSSRDELDSLAAALSGRSAETRLLAARRLGNLRDERAVPALIGALDAADFRVRQAAADALGNIGHAGAAVSLGDLLRDRHPRVRQSAVSALGRTGGRSDVPGLATLLDDPDVHVRQNVVSALGEIGRRSSQ